MRKIVTWVALVVLMMNGPAWAGAEATQARMKTIVFETLDFRAIAFSEAVQYLRDQSRERDPRGKGINVVLKLDPARNPVITLKLGKTSCYQALRMLTELAHYEWRFIGNTLVLEPRVDPKEGT